MTKKLAVQLNEVSFSYEPSELLLDAVSLEIDQGDFVAILGGNGQGKTTLLKLILGLLKPRSGKISLMGEDPESCCRKGKIAYIPQRATAFNNAFPATVEELVRSGLSGKLFYWPNKELKQKIAGIIKRVGLLGYEKHLLGELSGGQQQRAFLARALVSDFACLFLDEATSGIDAPSTVMLCCLLAEINQQEGKTILMITHDLDSIRAHANKILYLDNEQKLHCVERSDFEEFFSSEKRHFMGSRQ